MPLSPCTSLLLQLQMLRRNDGTEIILLSCYILFYEHGNGESFLTRDMMRVDV